MVTCITRFFARTEKLINYRLIKFKCGFGSVNRLKIKIPTNFIDSYNKKMPAQLEANAGIKFNFNILTYARSKNVAIIRRFYIKVKLLQPNTYLSCIFLIPYPNFLLYL